MKQSTAAIKSPGPLPSPVALASDIVQRWFDSILASGDPFAHGGGLAPLDEAWNNGIWDVRNVLAKSEGSDLDDPVQAEAVAAEAGYLIGVQVGLRLRGASR